MRAAAAAALWAALAAAGAAFAGEAGEGAKRAFFALEAKPFDRETARKAAQAIGRAYKAEPNDPWVLVAASQAVLSDGYIKGDRSRLGSYDPDSVKRADELARRAVALGPREPMAHIQRARLQIIAEDFRGAWDTLNRAYGLAPDGFYPWYYRGVISYRMQDAKRAAEAFDAAFERAREPYQKEWAVGRRCDLAHMQRDHVAEERCLKQLIEMSPGEPHPYGNYALFLKGRKRYDEAIEYYRKAIAIRPYPLAVEQLKQAEILREAARK